jgi:predicted phage-related endonuclease
MALSDAEKADVVFRLGWSGKVLIEGSTDYSKIIADRLTGLSAPIESQIRMLLGRLKKVSESIDSAICRLSAKIVGDITLRDDELYQLRREEKRIKKELSDLTDIPFMSGGGTSVCA